MHTFSSFSPLLVESVDSCRSIGDQLMVFDGEGRVLAVRSSDPSLRGTDDFFTLLESGERDFFLTHCASFEHDRLALMTRHGAAVVFCHLFPACGIFVAVFVDAAPSLLGQMPLLRSMGVDAFVPKEDLEGALALGKTLRIASDALCFDRERSGMPLDPVRTLVDRVCGMARLVGCHVNCSCEALSVLSEAFVFSLPAFTSILLLELMRVRAEAADRGAQVILCERDGRIFVEISSECDTKECLSLAFCREIAARKELPFEVRRAGTGETVVFSPTVCDVSYLGLKNPFLFE